MCTSHTPRREVGGAVILERPLRKGGRVIINHVSRQTFITRRILFLLFNLSRRIQKQLEPFVMSLESRVYLREG